MRRYLLALIPLLLAAACAATPEPRVSQFSHQAANELECVGDCLADGDETCEACVDRCMETVTPAAALAATGRGPLEGR